MRSEKQTGWHSQSAFNPLPSAYLRRDHTKWKERRAGKEKLRKKGKLAFRIRKFNPLPSAPKKERLSQGWCTIRLAPQLRSWLWALWAPDSPWSRAALISPSAIPRREEWRILDLTVYGNFIHHLLQKKTNDDDDDDDDDDDWWWWWWWWWWCTFSSNRSILFRNNIIEVFTNHRKSQISPNNVSASTMRFCFSSSKHIWSYSEAAATKITAVTPSKQWILQSSTKWKKKRISTRRRREAQQWILSIHHQTRTRREEKKRNKNEW